MSGLGIDSVWLEVFGRAHPLVLHLPIGVFAALLTLEVIAVLRRRPLEHGTRAALCGLLTLSALVTAGSGWLLGHEDAYGGDRLELHENLGIAFALVSVLIAASAWSDLRKLYGVALTAGLVLVTLTGHHGGSMTHGSDFLLAPLRDANERRGANTPGTAGAQSTTVTPGTAGAQSATVTQNANDARRDTGEPIGTEARAGLSAPNADFVGLQELLAARCGACHGADKHKGGLSLHSREALLAGGKGGPVVTVGDAASSELIQRMRLPLEHDDHMPPASKRQPSEEEIEQLEAWIDAGLPEVAAGSFGHDAPSTAEAVAGEALSVASVPAALTAHQQDAVETLRALQVHVASADPDTNLMWVDASASADFGDEQLAQLGMALRNHVADLSLSGTRVSDAALALLTSFAQLERLDLSNTAITAKGLADLHRCAALAQLNLSNTQVDDRGVAMLLEWPALQRVYVWNSLITERGVATLRSERPELQVVDGRDLFGDALEVEPAFELVEPPPQLGTGAQRYEWSPNWLQLPDGQVELGNTHGEIVVDRAGNLHLNTDTAQAIMVFAPDGSFLRSWGAEFANGLHGMQLVQEGGDEFLYFVHFGRHEFVKATLAGEIVWRMGFPEESGKYASAEQFNPTSIAVAPNGEFFVADGYGQHWVHHYDAQRNWLRAIGGQGSEPGRFQTPHGVWVDTRGAQPELLVADRENSRLQRFDMQGNWLGVIEGMLRRPCKLQQRGEYLVIPDLAGRVTILDGANELVTQLGDNPDPARRANNGVPVADWRDGEFLAPHSAAWDAHGNLYVMDWNQHGRITKLRRLGD